MRPHNPRPRLAALQIIMQIESGLLMQTLLRRACSFLEDKLRAKEVMVEKLALKNTTYRASIQVHKTGDRQRAHCHAQTGQPCSTHPQLPSTCMQQYS